MGVSLGGRHVPFKQIIGPYCDRDLFFLFPVPWLLSLAIEHGEDWTAGWLISL
jgi:hypothetical protein